MKVSANSLASIVSGGIAFDHPAHEPETFAVKNGHEYVLHSNFEVAEMGHNIELMLPWDSGVDIGAEIIYQGLTLGKIMSFADIDPKERFVKATAKITPRIRPYLTEDTDFYVVAAQFDLSGMKNMAQLLKGAHIEFRPADTGKAATSFQGLYSKATI